MYQPTPDDILSALQDRERLERTFLAAHLRAHRLREELRRIELVIVQAQRILGLDVQGVPWPPLPTPVRPPTLHVALAMVLHARNNPWMRTSHLALEVARRRLYRRRDGLPASTRDVSARVAAHPELFERSFYSVRLRPVHARMSWSTAWNALKNGGGA